MRNTRRQLEHGLGTDDFDSSVVQAAWAYHTQLGVGGPKSNAPVEFAAFIAGACWAKEVLVGERMETPTSPTTPTSPSIGRWRNARRANAPPGGSHDSPKI